MLFQQRCLAVIVMVGVTTIVQAHERPNILLLMADDLGYSDLGCYGGEIETPNIDSLAERGLRFSHFRASPMCVTSRVALLSGMPFHRAGANNYSHSMPLSVLLGSAGYRTMMTGKWHAGSPDPRSRTLFDRSFGFLSGMTDSFVGADDWFLDDKPFRNFGPAFYSTDAFAKRSIEFMKESVAKHKPFFMYVAFNAPHHPCQAPRPIVEKYIDRYRAGYETIRRNRHQRQIELGIVEGDSQLAPVGAETRHWDELTDHRKNVEAGRMAAYAAAVEGVDSAVGNLLEYLRSSGLEDNTLVIFLSDNGGDYSNGAIDTDEKQIAWKPGGNPSSSNGWASVKSTPLRYYKHACHEGGIAEPMIVRWPAGMQRPGGEIANTPTNITDFYPTFMELAKTEYPANYAGHQLRSLTGSSLLPLFQPNGQRPSQPEFHHYDFSRAWIEDEWKAVSLYNGPWQLFDLNTDRSETHDLATEHPERLAGLVAKWKESAVEAGVPKTSMRDFSVQEGWGWHRIKAICPGIHSVEPDNASISQSTSVDLKLTFNSPIDFRKSENKRIRLYSVSDETTPIWQADPDDSHPCQGKRTLSFDDLPPLEPDQGYFLLWDPGWIKVGGRPVGRLNDGAYWWRFRTPAKALDDEFTHD